MLNEQQLKAVNTIDGPVLSIACPGSGKTTMLIERTHHMITSGIAPEKILVISFTQTAAKEMRKRYAEKYGHAPVTFGTIHSFCYAILRSEKGYTNENILSPSESWEFFSDMLKQFRFPFSEIEDKVKAVQTEIGVVKNAELDPRRYEAESVSREQFLTILSEYEKFKHSKNKLDFDDMLVEAKRILFENGAVLKKWATRFDYIMVDEFQDTNKLQADIIYRIAKSGKRNLCVVGDDDQSLYKFRAADNRIFKLFTKEFPEAQVVHLDTNYRSLPGIIECAGSLIGHNRDRLKKDFKPFRTGDATIEHISCGTDNDMAKIVADEIEKLIKEGEDPKEIAVLYRINQLNQYLVNELMDKGIEFHVSEPPKDYHKDFMFYDVKKYYDFCCGKENKEILRVVLTHPTHYFKKGVFDNCDSLKSCQAVARMLKDDRKGSMYISSLSQIQRDREELKKRKTPREFLSYILYSMGYLKWLNEYASYMEKDFTEFYNNVMLLKKEAERFSSMKEWFDYANEYQEMIRSKKDIPDGVSLCTFHAAKGQEYKHVFIINADDKYCPMQMDGSDEEEERRCFYVAMTRAKDHLAVLWAGKKSIFLEESNIIKKEKKKNKENIFSAERKNNFGEKKDGEKIIVRVNPAVADYFRKQKMHSKAE